MINTAFIGYGLHDAVLKSIEIDWIEGSLTLAMSAVVPIAEEVVIVATKVIEFTGSRRYPWGVGDHIVYVNDVRYFEVENGPGVRLELELGSGDVVTVVASRIERSKCDSLGGGHEA